MSATSEEPFNSIEEAVSYWKQLALQRKEDYEKLEAEYFEFTDQSRALEEQQETQFEKFENELAQKTKELKIAREELRDLKEASVEQARTAQGDIQQLQSEGAKSNEIITKLKERIVHLEQKNEDLARKNREHESSLEKLSGDYDKHLEAHVVLQTEYEELKTKNMDIIQRMKDEIRDLREEQQHLEKQASSKSQLANGTPLQVTAKTTANGTTAHAQGRESTDTVSSPASITITSSTAAAATTATSASSSSSSTLYDLKTTGKGPADTLHSIMQLVKILESKVMQRLGDK